MRIISPFKDYYDIGQSMGVDTSLVYDRVSKVVVPNNIYYESTLGDSRLELHHYEEDSIEVRGELLGFCGKAYPSISFGEGEELQRFFQAEPLKKVFDEILNTCPRNGYWMKMRHGPGDYFKIEGQKSPGYSLDLKRLEGFFDPQRFQNSEFKESFHRCSAPVFWIGWNENAKKEVFEVNPFLKPFRFFELVDSYTAFQEISMFLGGVLSSAENKMIVLDDEMKLYKHGFDEKSFKKSKQKR